MAPYGQMFKLKARYLRDDGGQVPFALSPPTISGSLRVNQTVTVGHGLYDHGPILSYSYQWFIDGVLVPGATNQSFDLLEDHLESSVSVQEWAYNAAGGSVAPNDSESRGPIGAPSDGISVGAGYTGVGGSGFTLTYAPADDITKRQLANSKPQPCVGLMYPTDCLIMEDDIEIHIQAELTDEYANSATRGLSMALEVDILYESDTAITLTERETRTMTSPFRGTVKTNVHGFFAKLTKPVGFEFIEAGGAGCEVLFYIRVRPVDTARFDSKTVGPFKYYPRLPEHTIVKQLHKTATVGGNVVRNMADVMNAARAEFLGSGKAVIGEFIDSNKKWGAGKTSTITTNIPWITKFQPAFIGGAYTRWTLGDPSNMPIIGYWNPRLNRLYYGGHDMDIGESGGIVVGTNEDYLVVEDHETFSGGFPASGYMGNIFYPRFGSGVGAASLIRGRLASGAAYRSSVAGRTRIKSYFGYFHDLPGKSIEQFENSYLDRNDDISGTAIGNMFGHIYGTISQRFGGYYSGISCIKDGAANLSIKLTLGAGRPAYVGFIRDGTAGYETNRLYLYAGATRATAIAAGPIYTSPVQTNLRFDELAADITAHINCIANDISCIDNHDGPDLDATHVWVRTMESTQPLQNTDGGPIEIVGNEFQFDCTLDVHANGDAWAPEDIRHNMSRRDCMWLNYCGAGEVAVSTSTITPTSKFYDLRYVGCCWYNEGGFTDIEGNWQPQAAQGGRVIGQLDGVSFSRCVVAAYGSLYDSAVKVKRNVGYGYCFSNIGNIASHPDLWCIACVSPSWQVPTNAVNYRPLLTAPSNIPKDAYETFVNPAGGDFHVINSANILCADGVNYAGKYGPDGTDLSRIDF